MSSNRIVKQATTTDGNKIIAVVYAKNGNEEKSDPNKEGFQFGIDFNTDVAYDREQWRAETMEVAYTIPSPFFPSELEERCAKRPDKPSLWGKFYQQLVNSGDFIQTTIRRVSPRRARRAKEFQYMRVSDFHRDQLTKIKCDKSRIVAESQVGLCLQ